MSSATLSAKQAITAEEREKFERDGYFVRKGLVKPELLAQIRTETEGLHERMHATPDPRASIAWEKVKEGRPARIKQLMHSEAVCPGLNTLLHSNELLDVIEALIGPDISFFHSKLLMKAALDGTVTPWHQDFAYWKRGENRPVQVNAMLGIDVQNRANGAIQFVPGTHKAGLSPHENSGNKYGSFGIHLPGYFHERPDAVLCEMDPGDIVFFGSLVIHGSDGNKADYDRRANTMAFTTTGDDPAHSRKIMRGRGVK